MLVHHLPEAGHVRVVGDALEHDGGGAVGQGAVDDVGVARDPADVGGAPVDLAFLIVEDVLVGGGGIDQVATGGVQGALGLAGGAGGVEDEQRVLGVHGLGRAHRVGGGHGLVVPDVAALGPGDVTAGALNDDDGVDVGALVEGGVGVLLQRHVAAAAHTLVGGDDDAAIGVEDAVAQGVGGEAAKDDGVNGADAGAGEHGHRRLGDHGQVDANPVALLNALGLENIGQLADVGVQFAIGDLLVDVGIVGLPDDGDLIATAVQVPVEAVVGDVELATLEPLDVEVVGVVAVVHHLVEGLAPGDELIRLLGPEAIGIVDRPLVHGRVLFGVDVGLGGDVRGNRVGLDLRHGYHSPDLRGE